MTHLNPTKSIAPSSQFSSEPSFKSKQANPAHPSRCPPLLLPPSVVQSPRFLQRCVSHLTRSTSFVNFIKSPLMTLPKQPASRSCIRTEVSPASSKHSIPRRSKLTPLHPSYRILLVLVCQCSLP